MTEQATGGMGRIMAEEDHVRAGLAAGVVTVEEHRERMDALMDQGHAIGVIRQHEAAIDRMEDAGRTLEADYLREQGPLGVEREELAAARQFETGAWESIPEWERVVYGAEPSLEELVRGHPGPLDYVLEGVPAPGDEPDRRPYVGDGAEGALRSAQIDREESYTLERTDQRVAELEASARRWERQAERDMAPEHELERDYGPF
jgi:hypothetical protein